MKLGNFDDLIKKRFTDEEIAEIEKEAALEAELLRTMYHLDDALHDDDERIFIMALNDVLKAQLNNEQLHSIYPINDDPTLTTVKKAVEAIGLTLTIQERE